MGKKQHQKDKMYLTCTEWSTLYGGKKTTAEQDGRVKFRRLPFYCCSLSMQPFEHPYCTQEGVIFDLMAIVPFLKKYNINPATGEKMSAKDLVKLTFYKNSEDKYHCPVTFKVFNANTHIVAIKTTGNVFSYEAVERLNIKAGFWKDLLTDEPIARKDIVHLQDPTHLDKFNIAEFFHIKKNLKVVDEEEVKARKSSRYHLKASNTETKEVLDELDRTYKPAEKEEANVKVADRINAAHYSTGAVAASFTSTAMAPQTEHEAALIDEDLLRYERLKKKTYIRILTSLGTLNLELHSDYVPKTCENFLKHCINGYYKDTIFHRSIKNFMIQGGDPAGTGKGGESIWGKAFKDEIKTNLTHTGRGVVSMANSGPNTNKSQFFITYRSARHLDGKHTVFGRIVGGLETLDKMEAIEVDKHDKPKEDIKFLESQVFVNPYDEVDEMLKNEREEAIKKEAEEKKAAKIKRTVKPKDTAPTVYRSGVGKYISPSATKRTIDSDLGHVETKKKSKAKTVLNDFSAW